MGLITRLNICTKRTICPSAPSSIWMAGNFGLTEWILIRARFPCRIWHWPTCGCQFFGKNRYLLSGNCTNSRTRPLTLLPKRPLITRSVTMLSLIFLPKPSKEQSAMWAKRMCASTPVRTGSHGITKLSISNNSRRACGRMNRLLRSQMIL